MINLKEDYKNMLVEIFKNYCPKAEIWAYGSRVNGDSHSGSDLDLVVKSFNDENKKLFELKQLIYDSYIPFLVDINLYDYLPEYFKNEINKGYVVLYKGI